MKSIIYILLITLFFFNKTNAEENIESNNKCSQKLITSSEKYFPLSVGNRLYLKGYKKDDPSEIIKLKVEIKDVKEIDEESFYYLNAPGMDIRYLLKRDESGLYMRMIKYPFFFIGAINVDIDPPLNIFKFPVEVGLKWEAEAKAEASIFFFTIERDIKGNFEIVDKKTINTEAGILETFLVEAKVNHGKNENEIVQEKFWYARGIGYSRADTASHFAEIVGYRILDEESGEWKEKLPEHPEEFQ